jgi:hypothetical protein
MDYWVIGYSYENASYSLIVAGYKKNATNNKNLTE